MNLPQTRKLLLALLIALALSSLLAFLLDSLPLGLLAVALLLAFMGCAFSFWRCPRCGEPLGWVGKGIQFCPHCHQRIDK